MQVPDVNSERSILQNQLTVLTKTPELNDPVIEAKRLQQLYALDILDSGPETTFDRITLIACEVFGDSEAFLCFVDSSRIFFKSKTGPDFVCDFLNDSPFWRKMLLTDHPILLEDLTQIAEALPVQFTDRFQSYAASPLQTDEGYILGSLIVFGRHPFHHENTKFKILRELATLLMDQLTIRLTSKNAFTAYLGLMNQTVHDLKNPLTSIQLGAELMACDFSEESPMREFSTMIIRNVQKITGRINNLLNHATGEEEIVIKKISFDFTALLISVIYNLTEITKRKNQTIRVNAPESIFISGDPARIESILENLLGNAIKFSPPDKTIYTTVHVHDENLIIKIEDQGQGLSEDDHRKLFTRFSKLSSLPTGSESSHGLGLSIVKTLVELHHGKVWAESEGKNKGARFYVSLPLRM